MKVLILGGTAEGGELARRLQGQDVVLSLAAEPVGGRDYAVPLRIGGFGGAAGLAAALRAGGFARVIDATHPFAAQMKANADAACEAAGVPLLHLLRPGWTLPIAVFEEPADLASAAAALKPGSRVFLALGGRHLDAFRRRDDLHMVARMMVPDAGWPGLEVIVAAPPFSLEAEMEMLRSHRIDTLVARNSGGISGMAKLLAAGRLGLRVLLVQRPPVPGGRIVETVEAAMNWLDERGAA